MLKYPLTKQVFRSEEDYKEALRAVKEKVITIEELEILININVFELYNSIVSHFFGGEKINHENIYKRDIVHEYIEEFCPLFKRYFGILTNNGIIGVCGRGYTFDSERLKQSKEDYETMINVYFHKGIIL
ncbi:hypothetical protein BSK59_13145 [Paenibacillus odorifer]|uniref:hypothetical protein n=1 Tax=Paenibacillus odorifer TaxID=189426 RepID=UPI00096F7714|nr:hypothetical protein [Paenibacillus odorifer]OME55418.1 hypothetical protein BSK59_13145 [Paenibacillus odorifer]